MPLLGTSMTDHMSLPRSAIQNVKKPKKNIKNY